MVRHIVMWKLKDFAEGRTKQENIKYIKEELEALKDIIKEIKFIEVGANIKNAGINNDGSCDAVLYSEFETLEALEIYQNHPAHKKASEHIGKLRESRIAGDYII